MARVGIIVGARGPDGMRTLAKWFVNIAQERGEPAASEAGDQSDTG